MPRKTLKIIIVVFIVLFVLYWGILIAAIPFNGKTGSETDLTKSALRAHPPAPITKEITLKIVTFNVHDLYVLSSRRPKRMRAIAETLRALDPDIVGLQEAWIEKDRRIILDGLTGTRLKYHQYYPSGLVGSGKFILSAYPIVEALFHRYTKNGKWYKPYHGDWWGGKGVALACIELPEGAGYVDFYDTHAHAGYGTHEYDADREAQMRELADFVNASATGASPAFVVGDMNCRKGSKAFENAVNGAHLEWMMNGDPRIDNILAVKSERYTIELLDSTPIERKILVRGGETRLSDHTGYMSTIRIRPN